MLLIKHNYYFIPAFDQDKEEFDKISRGEVIECTIKRGRIPGHHRKYFALINFVFDNMPPDMHEMCPTKLSLRRCLQKLAGHVIEYRMPDGSVQVESDTINFSLPQKEFEEVYSGVVDAVLKYFITDLETQKIVLELS